MRQSKTDKEIRKLALDVAAGLVFGSWMFQTQEIADEYFPDVFKLLFLMEDAKRAALFEVDKTVHLYEYKSAATGSIQKLPNPNVYPTFLTSFRAMNKEEYDLLTKYYNELKEFLEKE